MSNIKIVESKFGRVDGQDVKRYVLKRGDEFEVALISYGATIQSVRIKDKNNEMTSVALGFDSLQGMVKQVTTMTHLKIHNLI